VPGWFEVAAPVVSGIVANKFRVSLAIDDYRQENQDALNVVQNIYLELTKTFRERGEGIRDVKSYAAKVSYTECMESLRRKYPGRTQLKNKIRYFLTHEPGFAVWETRLGEFHCGYAGWTAKEAASGASVNALAADPSKIPMRIKALDSMKAADWRNLADSIFEFLGDPVELDHMVAIIGSLFRIKDPPGEAPEPSVTPRPDHQLYLNEMIKRLWETLQDFEHRWLMAFLLNMPGYTKEARGEIEVFEKCGAASRAEIGRLLALSGKEYGFLADATPPAAADPGFAEGRMEMLWPHLPLEDILIANALGCEKQQVINLRAVAHQKAAKRMRELSLEKK